MDISLKKKLDISLRQAIDIIAASTDTDIISLLGDGILQEFLEAIAKPRAMSEELIYEYLLQNKNRLQLLAFLRFAITRNYSIKGKVEATEVYVSPSHIQWFPDGVMFLQGKNPFDGLIGLFKNGEVRFAIVKRDIKCAEQLGKDDFLGSSLFSVGNAIQVLHSWLR